ncbi:hypothetical protein FRX31_028440 [Thalictrum thalictroides]|uniref:Uncharacterized protein n=1 Tax=Thalictrum thalictroides TaxID=46969 RepID=A0A7J6VAQ9_THATH|nr:hypothetical protein FRX31_028440 [Thalictrum thalictroides]
MASSLQSSFSLGLTSRPKLKLKFHKHQHVRAQALGDEGRSTNIVDANMKALRERTEIIRAKERLQKCYRVEQAAGWCYQSAGYYDHTLKREAKSSESLELMVMMCRTFGLTIATSSFILCILSIVIHLRLLAQ